MHLFSDSIVQEYNYDGEIESIKLEIRPKNHVRDFLDYHYDRTKKTPDDFFKFLESIIFGFYGDKSGSSYLYDFKVTFPKDKKETINYILNDWMSSRYREQETNNQMIEDLFSKLPSRIEYDIIYDYVKKIRTEKIAQRETELNHFLKKITYYINKKKEDITFLKSQIGIHQNRISEILLQEYYKDELNLYSKSMYPINGEPEYILIHDFLSVLKGKNRFTDSQIMKNDDFELMVQLVHNTYKTKSVPEIHNKFQKIGIPNEWLLFVFYRLSVKLQMNPIRPKYYLELLIALFSQFKTDEGKDLKNTIIYKHFSDKKDIVQCPISGDITHLF